MTSSGTKTFDLSLNEIVDEAYSMCGLTARSGEDYRSARRSIDLLLVDWSNRGINFWTLRQRQETLQEGQATLTLDRETIDVLEAYTRSREGERQQTDLPLKRIGVKDWANHPNKLSRGRPVNVWVEKLKDAPVLHFWPVPDKEYEIVWHELAKSDDTGTNPQANADVPWRFLPPLVSGLAVKLAEKRAPDRLAILVPKYERDWDDAVAADRERRPTRFSPNLQPYPGGRR